MKPRLDRVRAVVTAARRLADPDDTLGREARKRLPSASGLSPEGVELALREYFELDARDDDLVRLVESQSVAPRCHLLLSANVCTAALRAYACGAAAASHLLVRCSSRDGVVAQLLARALADSDALTLSMVEQLTPAAGDLVHAYGSDETLADVAGQLPSGVRFVGHGTGLGMAIVERDADLGDAAERLADDMVAFDGRGCLSPRFAVVHSDEHGRTEGFARTLASVLEQRGATIPRGPLDDSARAELTRYRQLIETIGVFMEGRHHAVALDPAPTSLALPPAARAVLVVGCKETELAALSQPWLRFVTAIGHAGRGPLAQTLRRLAPRARSSPLGRMQKPPLDGPVDRRQLEKTSGA